MIIFRSNKIFQNTNVNIFECFAYYFTHFFIHNFRPPPYSYFNDSTGFFIAVFMD